MGTLTLLVHVLCVVEHKRCGPELFAVREQFHHGDVNVGEGDQQETEICSVSEGEICKQQNQFESARSAVEARAEVPSIHHVPAGKGLGGGKGARGDERVNSLSRGLSD